MNDDTGTQRVVGRLESDVNTLKDDVKELKAEQREQTQMLRTLTNAHERQKGGMAMLLSAATAAGAIAGMIIAWFKH